MGSLRSSLFRLLSGKRESREGTGTEVTKISRATSPWRFLPLRGNGRDCYAGYYMERILYGFYFIICLEIFFDVSTKRCPQRCCQTKLCEFSTNWLGRGSAKNTMYRQFYIVSKYKMKSDELVFGAIKYLFDAIRDSHSALATIK